MCGSGQGEQHISMGADSILEILPLSSVVNVKFTEGAVACCHLQAVKTRGVVKGHVFRAEAQTVK